MMKALWWRTTRGAVIRIRTIERTVSTAAAPLPLPLLSDPPNLPLVHSWNPPSWPFPLDPPNLQRENSTRIQRGNVSPPWVTSKEGNQRGSSFDIHSHPRLKTISNPIPKSPAAAAATHSAAPSFSPGCRGVPVKRMLWHETRSSASLASEQSGSMLQSWRSFRRQMSISEHDFEEVVTKKAKRFARTVEERTPVVSGVAFPDGNLLTKDMTESASAAHGELMQPKRAEDESVESRIPEVWGRVHSIESFSAVDGPGIRSVIFLQGCLRRCAFCSNPDTWSSLAKCQRLSSKDIATRLKRNVGYYRGGGGVTLSGGEPMMQPQFCGSIFKEAHALGVTTCLDTAGYGHSQDWAEVLPHTDMVMLCTKAVDPKLYFKLVEVKQKVMLDFAKAVADYGVPLRLRFVLVPGLTDTKEEVEGLVEWAKQQPTLVGIEMLPYHRLGVSKWDAMGLKYPLEGMEPPPKETIDHWKAYIQSQGIKVML